MDVRASRELLKLSQRELAEKLGASQSAVAQWERGETNPSPAVLKALEGLTWLLVRRENYPSAPSAAGSRRRFFWARNHLIANPGAEPLSEADLDAAEVAYLDRRRPTVGRKG